MKWAFQLALRKRMAADPRVYLIMCDIGKVMFADIRRDFPNRVFNAGVCEQATVTFAAGMASQGFRPVVYTILPFLLERALEQIKLDVLQMHLPVGLVGFEDEENGPTHICVDAFQIWETYFKRDDYSRNLITNGGDPFPQKGTQVTAFMESVDLDRPWFLHLQPEKR